MAFSLMLITTPYANADNDKGSRILVNLPDDIKDKTLILMRAHIRALEDIIHAIQSDDYNKAEDLVETQLRWGSPELVEDHEITKHWPKPMQQMANQLYNAASNYVDTSQNAATINSNISEEDVIASLGKVVTACRSCHETYRIR